MTQTQENGQLHYFGPNFDHFWPTSLFRISYVCMYVFIVRHNLTNETKIVKNKNYAQINIPSLLSTIYINMT